MTRFCFKATSAGFETTRIRLIQDRYACMRRLIVCACGHTPARSFKKFNFKMRARIARTAQFYSAHAVGHTSVLELIHSQSRRHCAIKYRPCAHAHDWPAHGHTVHASAAQSHAEKMWSHNNPGLTATCTRFKMTCTHR